MSVFDIALVQPASGFNVAFGSASSPGAAAGALGTLTATAPAAVASGGVAVSGALASVAATSPAGFGSAAATAYLSQPLVANVVAPVGIAGAPAAVLVALPSAPTPSAPQASAGGGSAVVVSDLPTIGVTGLDGGLPQTSALNIVPVVDYAISATAPEAQAISGGANIAAPMPVVNVAPPLPYIPASTVAALPGQLTLSAPTGSAERILNPGTGLIPFVTLTAPDAVATGAASARPPIPEGQTFLLIVRTTQPSASVISGDQGLVTTFPNTFQATPPEATGGPAVLVTGYVPQIAVGAPGGAAGVPAQAGPERFGSDGDYYWVRITRQAPEAVASAGADFSVSFNLTVGLTGVPIPITNMSASLLVALPAPVELKPFTGAPTVIAFADFGEPIQVNKPLAQAAQVIQAFGALPTVNVIAPVAMATVDDIGVTPPGGGASGGASAVAALPAALTVTSPVGVAIASAPQVVTLRTFSLRAPAANVQAGSAGFANGLTATITLLTPEAVATGAAEVIAQMGAVVADAPDGWADDGMEGHVRLKRTQVAGRAPAALSPREIVLNEADGALHHRDRSGGKTALALAAVMRQLVPPGGEAGQVLAGDGSWTDPAPTYPYPIRLRDQGRIRLAEGCGQSLTTAPPRGRVLYRPFFVAKPIEISALSIEVTTAGDAVAHLGICAWNLTGTPGEVIAHGTVSCAATGERTVAAPCFLTVGWYAAMCGVVGAGAPVLSGQTAPVGFDADLEPVGDLSAAFTTLDPAPLPTATEATASAFVLAQVTA